MENSKLANNDTEEYENFRMENYLLTLRLPGFEHLNGPLKVAK